MLQVKHIARTVQEKKLGLSIFEHLLPGRAMLFIYEDGTSTPFWNKGVKFPIDIAFYSKHGNLLYHTHLSPDERKLVAPNTSFYYVLETNVGEFKPEKYKNLFNNKEIELYDVITR